MSASMFSALHPTFTPQRNHRVVRLRIRDNKSKVDRMCCEVKGFGIGRLHFRYHFISFRIGILASQWLSQSIPSSSQAEWS